MLADAGHPLEPLDLSSPRATLNSFLTAGDSYFRLLRDEYWESPSREVADHLHELGVKAQSMLDLREVPPAARFEIGRDATVYLYEVLSRIELPPESDIPDATALALSGDDKAADGRYASWTIPHTEITLERVTDGPRKGQYLFSTATVANAGMFYQKTRGQTYRRDVPLENYAEMRD